LSSESLVAPSLSLSGSTSIQNLLNHPRCQIKPTI
jgi:hypothetical protein